MEQPVLLGVYTSPVRHPQQAISICYVSRAPAGQIKPGDDAIQAEWFDIKCLPKPLAFDHEKIIADFLKMR
jgi:8-oxo-dGTP diphosphatase